MRRVTKTAWMASVALLPWGMARAQGVAFTPVASIYQDAKEGALRAPEGVACNGSTVVVADTGGMRLVSYALKDGSVVGGTEMKVPQLVSPVRVEMDSKGNLLVLDRKTSKILRVDAKGALQGVFEVKGAQGPVDVRPVAFKVAASDDVLVLDSLSRSVLMVDPAGTVRGQLELPKTGVFTDLCTDPAGTIYAVDGIAAVVWSAKKDARAFTALSQSLKDRMNFPSYITASQGRLLVVDQNGGGIVVLGNDGSYQGRQLSMGWSEGFVYYPSQLCVTAGGEAFLADRQNNRVQFFRVER